MKPMIALREETIFVQEIVDSVRDPAAGGIDIFLGTTRDNSKGKRVLALEYEVYEPMVLEMLGDISREAGRRWNVTKVTVVHRKGRVTAGEISVAIAVAAVHRADAFEACRWLIDTLKKDVPIWKKEIYTDGSSWVEGTVL